MGIKLERTKNSPYEVNFNNGIRPERYVWNPSKSKYTSVIEVSEECYMSLLQNSCCFKDGDLRIIEENKAEQDVVEIDEYKANCHTREEIEKLLKGSVSKLKTELDKITNQTELSFFVDVAKDLKIEKMSVLKALSERIGTDIDILFDEI